THLYFIYFFNITSTTEIYTLSLHDALPIFLFRYELFYIYGLALFYIGVLKILLFQYNIFIVLFITFYNILPRYLFSCFFIYPLVPDPFPVVTIEHVQIQGPVLRPGKQFDGYGYQSKAYGAVPNGFHNNKF